MTPSKLFAKRLFSELKFRFNIWRIVIDWTVALYIVIPALFIGAKQYLHLWESPPSFLTSIPVNLLFLVCYLFAWAGSIRIFLIEGDQLFLINKESWIKRIIVCGLCYSFALNLLLSFLFFALLAPIMFQHYLFTLSQLIILFLITYISKNVLGLLRQLLSLNFSGWRWFLITRGTIIVTGLIFMALIPHIINSLGYAILATTSLIVALIILIAKRLYFKGSFFADVIREQEEKLKYVSTLLSFSGIDIKKPKKHKKTSWFFRHSNRIFKKRTTVNDLVELNIKSVLRNKQRLSHYLQLFFICALVTLSISGEVKWVVWLALVFVFTNFVGLYWKESFNSDFLQLFSWDADIQRQALQKFLFIMVLPSFLLIAFIGGLQSFSLMQSFIILLPCGVVIYFICNAVAFYLMVTAKRKKVP